MAAAHPPLLSTSRHATRPGVIRARFFTTSSPVCIGLDYCAGGALKEHIARAGLAPKDKLMFVTQVGSRFIVLGRLWWVRVAREMSSFNNPFPKQQPQIASSMAFIHAKGIAHLDLKTANILLTKDKRSTVIADFGISQTRAGFGGSALPTPTRLSTTGPAWKCRCLSQGHLTRAAALR